MLDRRKEKNKQTKETLQPKTIRNVFVRLMIIKGVRNLLLFCQYGIVGIWARSDSG